MKQDTICALSTANGTAATATIKISGDQALEIVDAFFKAKNPKKTLQNSTTHTAIFGDFFIENRAFDEVLTTVYKNPNSYTGEDVVEISCHGSLFIQQKILETLQQNNIRLANPGEFTQRAYLNKKMDLSQAEAVADLVASESEAAHQIALQQMRGGFASVLKKLREELIQFAALIELELDFSEEDVEFVDRHHLEMLLKKLKTEIKKLIDSFSYGNVIKKGVPVAIAGKPNAGKSSLLNLLLNENKAIVSSIAGTTRDTIEDTLTIEGVLFRLIDTAGLRETQDEIEKIGVEKAREKVQQAKILLYMFDRMDSTPEEVIEDVKSFYRKGLEIILIENKIDQYGGFIPNEFNETLKNVLFDEYEIQNLIGISTQEENDKELIEKVLLETVQGLSNQSEVSVSNTRHIAELEKSMKALISVENGLHLGISGDFLAQDIREAILHLGNITGEIDMDVDVLGTIFSKFCIGK